MEEVYVLIIGKERGLSRKEIAIVRPSGHGDIIFGDDEPVLCFDQDNFRLA